MLEDRLRLEDGFGDGRHAGERKRRLKSQLSNGKRSSRVARLADLAVLFIEGLLVPVDEGVKSQSAHDKDEDDGEEPFLDGLRHHWSSWSPNSEDRLDAGWKATVV